MKKQLIAHIAQKLKSFGYTVYVSKDGAHGFYTNGVRVVSFGGSWKFSVDFSGNYRAHTSDGGRRMGTGWQIAKECSDINQFDADLYIKCAAPSWATGNLPFSYTTPEEHLKTYGASSGYSLFE